MRRLFLGLAISVLGLGEIQPPPPVPSKAAAPAKAKSAVKPTQPNATIPAVSPSKPVAAKPQTTAPVVNGTKPQTATSAASNPKPQAAVPTATTTKSQPPAPATVVTAIKGQFSGTCALVSAPNVMATSVCMRGPKDPILSARAVGKDYLYVDTQGCQGFVRTTCVRAQTVTVARDVARIVVNKYKLGVTGNFDGSIGKVPYSPDASKGMNFGATALVKYSVDKSFEIGVGAGFQMMKLSREIDATGSLGDVPAEFEQSGKYLTGNLDLGFMISERTTSLITELEWWIHGGVQYYHPLSATQTRSGTTITIQSDKYLVAYLGPTVDANLSQSFNAIGSLQIFYNVSSMSAPTFYGIRFVLGADLPLG